MSIQSGQQSEQLAKQYLEKHGLQTITTNFRCRSGELDLIMRDGKYIVFVEVRARQSAAFGGALVSITSTKQQKLIRTASLFLSCKKWQNRYPCRFDVVALDGVPPQIQWIKNAFSA